MKNNKTFNVGQCDFYAGELPANDSEKCPVIFVLDRSGSMSGSPIDELNKGLSLFESEISKDTICRSMLDIAIISFGSDTKVERDFGLVDQAPFPIIKISGSTRLCDGLLTGLDLLEKRKVWFRETAQNYKRPYLILITDGAPDSDQDVPGTAVRIKSLVQNKHLNFWPIGVQGANMRILEQLSAFDTTDQEANGSLPPMMLDGLQFSKLFKFLSNSFQKISRSIPTEKTDLTPTKEENPFVFKT